MSDFLAPHVFRMLRNFGNTMSCGQRVRLPQTLLRRLFRFADSEVVVADFDGALFMRLSLSEHMQRRIFWMGYYSSGIVSLLKKLIKPGMVVVDVGANIGEITLVAAQCVGRSGKVIAFEPVSAIADRLTEHVQRNHLNQVLIRREALGEAGDASLPIYASCGQDVSDKHLGLASLYKESESQAPIEYVKVATLDNMASSLALTRVDLIKIDIEGGELACLRGSEFLLRRYQPMLVVEVQEFSARQAGWDVEEFFQYLRGFGYEFFIIGSRGQLSKLDPNSLADFQNVFCKVSEETGE